MTQVQRFWPFSTHALPKICSVRGCYKDAEKSGPFCEVHARAQKLRLLVGAANKPALKRPRRPSYVGADEWERAYPAPTRLFPTNLYAIRTERHVKFGVAENVRKRLAVLQTGAPEKLTLHGSVPAVIEVETAVHRYLKQERVHGEWFNWTPRVIAVASLVRAKDLPGLLELMDDQELIRDLAARVSDPKPRENLVCRPVD